MDDHCSICYNDFGDDVHTTLCGHKFCADCIHKWTTTHDTCPYCRTVIVKILYQYVDIVSGEKIIDQSNENLDMYSMYTDIFMYVIFVSKSFNSIKDNSLIDMMMMHS